MINQQLRFVILLAAATCTLTTASAGEPEHKLLGPRVPDCIGMWSCDDYCPKRLPCVGAPLCFTCDDYCPKKEPCVCDPLCFGCDDYRQKCLPPVCSPACYGSPQCVADCDALDCDSLARGIEIVETTAPELAPRLIAAKPVEVEELATEKPSRLPPVYVGQLPPGMTE